MRQAHLQRISATARTKALADARAQAAKARQRGETGDTGSAGSWAGALGGGAAGAGLAGAALPNVYPAGGGTAGGSPGLAAPDEQRQPRQQRPLLPPFSFPPEQPPAPPLRKQSSLLEQMAGGPVVKTAGFFDKLLGGVQAAGRVVSRPFRPPAAGQATAAQANADLATKAVAARQSAARWAAEQARADALRQGGAVRPDPARAVKAEESAQATARWRDRTRNPAGQEAAAARQYRATPGRTQNVEGNAAPSRRFSDKDLVPPPEPKLPAPRTWGKFIGDSMKSTVTTPRGRNPALKGLAGVGVTGAGAYGLGKIDNLYDYLAEPVAGPSSAPASGAPASDKPAVDKPAVDKPDATSLNSQVPDIIGDASKGFTKWVQDNWKLVGGLGLGAAGLYALYRQFAPESKSDEDKDRERWERLPKLAAAQPIEFSAHYPRLAGVLVMADDQDWDDETTRGTIKRAAAIDPTFLDEYIQCMRKCAADGPQLESKPAGSSASFLQALGLRKAG